MGVSRTSAWYEICVLDCMNVKNHLNVKSIHAFKNHSNTIKQFYRRYLEYFN